MNHRKWFGRGGLFLILFINGVLSAPTTDLSDPEYDLSPMVEKLIRMEKDHQQLVKDILNTDRLDLDKLVQRYNERHRQQSPRHIQIVIPNSKSDTLNPEIELEEEEYPEEFLSLDSLYDSNLKASPYDYQADDLNNQYDEDSYNLLNSEIFSKKKHKKDLESLLYQANPALTVAELPTDPKITFRKYDHSQQSKESTTTTTTTPSIFSNKLRGMKEVVQPRPAPSRKNVAELHNLVNKGHH